jgi:hypothetical protein
MKEVRPFLYGSIFTSIAWIVNKFFKGEASKVVCDFGVCLTPMDVFMTGMVLLLYLLAVSKFFDDHERN